METYFHNDPRIREWIDQITEKIFTVDLLSGIESDTEFQNGCLIVREIASLLQEIPSIPSEFLADGVIQLLEQQLPDKRIIDNFPAFKVTMDRMVREGILQSINSQNKETFDYLPTSNDNTEKDRIELQDNFIGAHLEESNEEHDVESSIPAFATINIPCPDMKKGEFVNIEVEDPQVLITDMTTTEYDANAAKTEHLKHVLSNIFPDGTVHWNKTVMGQTFVAQVNDILICLHNLESPLSLKNIHNEGWKVLMCRTEDLMFPRRLERALRQIRRSGQKSITV